MVAALVVVGGGKMGEALLAGLLDAATVAAEEAVVVDASPERRAQLEAPEGLAGRHRGLEVRAEVPPASAAIVAVKPDDVAGACRALAGTGVARVLSIAAGVPLARLEAWLVEAGEPGPAVMRAMPNTPALIGAAASAVSAGSTAGPADMAWAERMLGAVGTVVRLPEAALDAVTGLSGSGPAYVFLLAEALIDAGVLVGLPRPVARDLAVQTILGSAQLLASGGDEPAVLRAGVTSPGGTTAAGLRALEAAGWRAAVLEAVVAATERSRQLGG
ncbi:MAG: pyrroline-5-carboxylate reductase [Acidimicrobiales bacterium]